ncbi:hypothetical protein SGRIM128S_07707 [Streptomyces griseomycini]
MPRAATAPTTAVSCSSLRIGTRTAPRSASTVEFASPVMPSSSRWEASGRSCSGSAGRTRRVRPPTLAFSSSMPPFAMTLPRSTTVSSEASCSASSMYWVVSSTVTPSPTMRLTSSHTSLRVRGSRPVVGSSRYSTAGCPIMEAARSRRRRMPPE